MEHLLKNFEEQLRLFNDGEITSDDFFNWVCKTITLYGGKLPPKQDDVTNPPNE